MAKAKDLIEASKEARVVTYSDLENLFRAAAPVSTVSSPRLLNGRWIARDGDTYAPLQPMKQHYTPPLPTVEVKKPEEPF